MDILSFKALHLVGMVAWFVGVFYLVRLFVYHAEAFSKQDPEKEILTSQYALMERRLYKIITNPAMIVTFIGGFAMLAINPEYLKQPWMHVKLTLVILLAGYTGACGSMMKKLAKGALPMSSFRFRLFNEVPSLFLVAIVLLAVFRDRLSILLLLGILLGLIVVLGGATMLYKKWREKAKSEERGAGS